MQNVMICLDQRLAVKNSGIPDILDWSILNMKPSTQKMGSSLLNMTIHVLFFQQINSKFYTLMA